MDQVEKKQVLQVPSKRPILSLDEIFAKLDVAGANGLAVERDDTHPPHRERLEAGV